MNCILGIDPGLSGAVAFYWPSHPKTVSVEDMPTVDKWLDVATLADRIRQMNPDEAVIEKVWAQPGEGPKGAFAFGSVYGATIGIIACLGIPYRFVSSQRWKRHYNLIGEDKEASRATALRTWPERAELFDKKKDHNRAEAALIARYGFISMKEAAQ